LEPAGPVLPEIVRTEIAALGAIIVVGRDRQGGNSYRVGGRPHIARRASSGQPRRRAACAPTSDLRPGCSVHLIRRRPTTSVYPASFCRDRCWQWIGAIYLQVEFPIDLPIFAARRLDGDGRSVALALAGREFDRLDYLGVGGTAA
jgi:hypothetical protein